MVLVWFWYVFGMFLVVFLVMFFGRVLLPEQGTGLASAWKAQEQKWATVLQLVWVLLPEQGTGLASACKAQEQKWATVLQLVSVLLPEQGTGLASACKAQEQKWA